MKSLRSAIALATISYAALADADAFKNEADHSWATTPNGTFECKAGKSGRTPDTLSLAGKILFKGSFMSATTSDGTLSSGIYNANTGCPSVVGSNLGYVVMVRQIQPPAFGVNGYIVLDTNAKPPEVIELAESQSPKDDNIPEFERIAWKQDGIVLRYFGYPVGTQGGDANSPKPKRLMAHYSFKSGDVKQAK